VVQDGKEAPQGFRNMGSIDALPSVTNPSSFTRNPLVLTLRCKYFFMFLIYIKSVNR